MRILSQVLVKVGDISTVSKFPAILFNRRHDREHLAEPSKHHCRAFKDLASPSDPYQEVVEEAFLPVRLRCI